MSPTEEQEYTSPHIMQTMNDVRKPQTVTDQPQTVADLRKPMKKNKRKLWRGIRKGLGCFDDTT